MHEMMKHVYEVPGDRRVREMVGAEVEDNPDSVYDVQQAFADDDPSYNLNELQNSEPEEIEECAQSVDECVNDGK